MADDDRNQEEMRTNRRESEQGNNDLQQQSRKDATGKRYGHKDQITSGNKGGGQMTGLGNNGISEDDEDLGGRAGQSGSQAGSTPRSGNSGQ